MHMLMIMLTIMDIIITKRRLSLNISLARITK